MDKPSIKPSYPYFSSGPCAKPPGWSLSNLKNAAFSRSHRSEISKSKLKEVIDKSRKLLEIPDDYLIGIVPGSDTGAVEMAMWSMLGPKDVEVYSWENFGRDWTIDVLEQLPLKSFKDISANYGVLPDFSNSDPNNDIIFTWNGTTSGVRIKDASWISNSREGLTICDATSAAFSMYLDWPKLDVTTYSWQKVLGSEAAHGMIILSPRAIDRLENYTPKWPIPKVFRMAEKGKLNKALFEGVTINTPSLLCVEDVLNSLNWAIGIGGLKELVNISEKNLSIVKSWIEKSENFDISDLISNTVSKYETKKIFFEKKSEILFIGRKNLIKRSLSNFIDNALKYSDKVVIDIKKSVNNIVINIDDNGIGIPEKERENVFKPFYKIDKSRGDSKSSVGLGMSIASDMIQSHGGSIKLENSSLGGLRVKIFLPF